MQTVYVDNASTTKVRQEVLDIMLEYNEYYGNPSSSHSMGQKARELIENARSQISKSIGSKSNEIIFTSGGTESNNLALQGFINATSVKRGHIITTSIEHMSVLNPIEYLYETGCDVTILPVDNDGIVSLQQLKNSIRRNTILISIMFANNEIGTIQPIKEIGNICKQYGICFHTDAVSAFGHCNIDVDELGIDMMSISGHKIYVPKGIGVLYAKNDIELYPMIRGSGQEYGLRSGTENISGIVGMGKAVKLLDSADTAHITALSDKLINGIKENISNVKFNGSTENSLCNIVNVSFKGINGEKLLIMLDEKGIYASSGSPYLPYRPEPSHVMTAIGVSNIPVRFSFGRYNTEDDIDYIINILPDLVEKLRKEAL